MRLRRERRGCHQSLRVGSGQQGKYRRCRGDDGICWKIEISWNTFELVTYFMYWPMRNASLTKAVRMNTTLMSWNFNIARSRLLLILFRRWPAKYFEYWSNQAEMKSRKKRQQREKQNRCVSSSMLARMRSPAFLASYSGIPVYF